MVPPQLVQPLPIFRVGIRSVAHRERWICPRQAYQDRRLSLPPFRVRLPSRGLYACPRVRIPEHRYRLSSPHPSRRQSLQGFWHTARHLSFRRGCQADPRQDAIDGRTRYRVRDRQGVRRGATLALCGVIAGASGKCAKGLPLSSLGDAGSSGNRRSVRQMAERISVIHHGWIPHALNCAFTAAGSLPLEIAF